MIETFLQDPAATLVHLPPLVLPLFVLVSAALEYVIPPYWGDMFVLLGFFLAAQGVSSPWLIFLCALIGSCLGSLIAFSLGRRYGVGFLRRVTFRSRTRPGGRQKRMRALLENHGEKVLLANRFIPVVRGFLLYGAGAFDLRLGPSMLYSGISNAAWAGIMMVVGLYTSGSWESIQGHFRSVSQWVALLMVVALLLGAIWAWWNQNRRK